MTLRCSPRHKSCSPWHYEMVREYQRERERQQTALDELTSGWPGELAHWKANGGKLIDFQTWLRAHRGHNTTT